MPFNKNESVSLIKDVNIASLLVVWGIMWSNVNVSFVFVLYNVVGVVIVKLVSWDEGGVGLRRMKTFMFSIRKGKLMRWGI